ncbi:hypothetical protein PM082_009378 [Marasmius tenuissimus]|nr:hypothetical protein PM082_009378 [Marasmius tenuissimus]
MNNRKLFLAIQPLLHTSPNVFKKKVWTDSILCTSRKRESKNGAETGRRFKIALALDFKEYVLVFCSWDNLFGIRWSFDTPPVEAQCLPHVGPTGGDLGTPTVYRCFLESVAQWAADVFACGCGLNDIIYKVLRYARGPWNGLGVYTTCEVLWYAGLSPWLTLIAVITNPSRLARLCEGFFVFMLMSHLYNRRALKRVLTDTRDSITLNATLEEVLDYSKSHLIVYGRSDVKVSNWVRNELDNPKGMDVYEYCLTEAYYDQPGHLGYMIWQKSTHDSLQTHNDPIAQFFLTRLLQVDGDLGKFFKRKAPPTLMITHLPSQPPTSRKKGKNCSYSIPTMLYRPDGHSLWTLIKNSTYYAPPPPSPPPPRPLDTISIKKRSTAKQKRSQLKQPKKRQSRKPQLAKGVKLQLMDPTTDEYRSTKLIAYVKCETKHWTVGPLDFCGVAKVIVHGKKRYLMYSDSHSWSDTAQDIYGYRESLRQYEGNLKRARTGIQKRLLDQRRLEVRKRTRERKSRQRKEGRDVNEEGLGNDRPKRPRAPRVSADQAIVAMSQGLTALPRASRSQNMS